VASLLEVGTGFHPELTGRENIYLNGTILGMRRAEVERKFDDIVEFAEIERFIDTPVKRYSSGMYVRLAFAVAAHLEPEILLIDEVLAVGDAAFQRKCLGRMEGVAKEGRTVLFVSHNMGAIMTLCHRCLLLEEGCKTAEGKAEDVVARYFESSLGRSRGEARLEDSESAAFFTNVSIVDAGGDRTSWVNADSGFRIRFTYTLRRAIRDLRVAFNLFDRYGLKILYDETSASGVAGTEEQQPGDYVAHVEVPGNFLLPGMYSITAALHQPKVEMFDFRDAVLQFSIVDSGGDEFLYGTAHRGSVRADFPWKVERSPPTDAGRAD
jgi:lipopolysaccharide transport system ATP-binding protein